MYNTKQSPTPSDTPSGVLFYNHFPSNFLRPYGVADSQPHDKTILKRVNPKNCKWLICPQVGISKFAATINENMEFLATADNALIHMEKFSEMQQMLSGFLKCLHRLNTRNMENPIQQMWNMSWKSSQRMMMMMMLTPLTVWSKSAVLCFKWESIILLRKHLGQMQMNMLLRQ